MLQKGDLIQCQLPDPISDEVTLSSIPKVPLGQKTSDSLLLAVLRNIYHVRLLLLHRNM